MVDMGPTSGLSLSEAIMGKRSATQVGGVCIRSSIQQGGGVIRSSSQGGGLGDLDLLILCVVGDGDLVLGLLILCVVGDGDLVLGLLSLRMVGDNGEVDLGN